jgi:acyl-CoA thioester hydrolase
MGQFDGNVYTHPIIVEFEDVDSYKIAHHPKIIAYLERARVHFLKDVGLELHPEGLSIVLYSLDIRFKRPAFLLDCLNVSVFVKAIDSYRLELAYVIRRDKDLLVRATTGIAFMDSSSNLIIEAPSEYLEKIRILLR